MSLSRELFVVRSSHGNLSLSFIASSCIDTLVPLQRQYPSHPKHLPPIPTLLTTPISTKPPWSSRSLIRIDRNRSHRRRRRRRAIAVVPAPPQHRKVSKARASKKLHTYRQQVRILKPWLRCCVGFFWLGCAALACGGRDAAGRGYVSGTWRRGDW